MSEISEGLTRKLGPLPAWAWGAVLGGAILGFRFLRSRGLAGTAGGAPTVTVEGGTPVGAPASVPAESSAAGSFMAAGTYAPPVVTATPAGYPSTASTNEQWSRDAIALVAARAPGIPLLSIQDALTKFLDGKQITEAESGIVNTAYVVAGAPPVTPPVARVIPIRNGTIDPSQTPPATVPTETPVVTETQITPAQWAAMTPAQQSAADPQGVVQSATAPAPVVAAPAPAPTAETIAAIVPAATGELQITAAQWANLSEAEKDLYDPQHLNH